MCPCALTEHHAITAYWGVKVQIHAFLPSALDGGEWLDSRPGRFSHGERAPATYWIGDWVGPRAGLDVIIYVITKNNADFLFGAINKLV
jgi:hypothetical protein